VLLKVNDIPLAGFEWNTFLDKKSDSIVAGPFRESTEELLFRARFDCTKMKQYDLLEPSSIFVRPLSIYVVSRCSALTETREHGDGDSFPRI
jgi:hypothetical protein